MPYAPEYRRKLDALVAERDVLGGQLARQQQRLEDLKAEGANLDKARALVQQAALDTQESLRVRLESVVTTALRAVFKDKQLEFRITFETKRGRTEALLEVGEDGQYSHPMETHGGGVVDVVSFALRVAFWSIDQSRPVLVLDEPMKFLSRDLVPNAAEMVRMLSQKLGLQIIMVSHIEEFIDGADRVFRISRRGNQSFVELAD